mmetsp:Transcript_29453/g.28168  ORF Transcript_29453/g.28168 Transcript_29453/m.28168 type:complete len:410 (-) Transcript_29453:199-1428(-)
MPSATSSDDVLNVLRRRYSTIESLIENPICRGYLLKFSESQFNSENINFITAVDHFRDEFFNVDKDMWSASWRDIDSEVENSEKEGKLFSDTWNSEVNMMAIKTNIDSILHEYIFDHAQHQVCISKCFISKTMKRIDLLNLYGPHVFEEAVLDPIKTMRKDVLPRFFQSNDYDAMIFNLASCDPLPPASSIRQTPPRKHVLNNNPLEYFTVDRKFTLEQMLIAEVLYHFFRVYLERIHASENLLCVRMIDYYDELIKKTETKEEAGEIAWMIYQYFVAPGSAFEVSTMHADRKILMESLSMLKIGMFSRVRKTAYVVLEVNFVLFQGSKEYNELGLIMRTVKLNMVKAANYNSLTASGKLRDSFFEILGSKSNDSDDSTNLTRFTFSDPTSGLGNKLKLGPTGIQSGKN